MHNNLVFHIHTTLSMMVVYYSRVLSILRARIYKLVILVYIICMYVFV